MFVLDTNHKSGIYPALDRVDEVYLAAGWDTEWMDSSFVIYGPGTRMVAFNLATDPAGLAKVEVYLYDEDQDLDEVPVEVDPIDDRKLITSWLSGRSKALQRRAKVAQG